MDEGVVMNGCKDEDEVRECECKDEDEGVAV